MKDRIGAGQLVFGLLVRRSGEMEVRKFHHMHLSPIYSHGRTLGAFDFAEEGDTLITVVVTEENAAVIIGVSCVAGNDGWASLASYDWLDLPTRVTQAVQDRIRREVGEIRQKADEAELASYAADKAAMDSGNMIAQESL